MSLEEPSVEEAKELARTLHAGQYDAAGTEPHFEHVQAVVDILLATWPNAPETAVKAAYLHDAVEDTEETAESLRRRGFSEAVVELVAWLTRDPDMTYMDWIRALATSGPLWAARIKWADNRHNGSDERISKLPPERQSIRKRYERARRVLEPVAFAA